MKISNPFIVKGTIPEAYFCDRVAETQKLKTLLLNRNNVVLKSPRRVGKSGLVLHTFAQPEIAGNYYVFFVDILSTSSLQEFTFELGKAVFSAIAPISKRMTDLFFRTVRSIHADYGVDMITGYPKFSFSLGAIANPLYTLEEIFQCIEAADRRCIIAFDEFQRITSYPEQNIEAVLRTHIQHMSNCDFIFAGSERHLMTRIFDDSSRPFYNSTASLNLDPIQQDVYSDFVCEHFAEFGKSIDKADVQRVYSLFRGNTFCMQQTFNISFLLTEKGKTCSLERIRYAIDEILLDKERDYQGHLASLSLRPKELLYAIARQGEATQLTSAEFIHRHHLSSSSSVQSCTKQLLDGEWITFDVSESGEKIYRLSEPFLSLWIQDRFGTGFYL